MDDDKKMDEVTTDTPVEETPAADEQTEMPAEGEETPKAEEPSTEA